MADTRKITEAQPARPRFTAYVVVTLEDFLAEHVGGNLIPTLTLRDPQTREEVTSFDLEIRSGETP